MAVEAGIPPTGTVLGVAFLALLVLAACGGGQAGGSAGPGGVTAPAITRQPADQTVAVGQTATFTVTASGTPPLTYQWSGGGTAINGATAPSYSTPPATQAMAGTRYLVRVANAAGAVTSSAATLTVTSVPAGAITITANPDPGAWTPISPYIYGLNSYTGTTSPPRNLTLDRMGGNRWTAYNWETNASNAGSDYLYESDGYLSPSAVPAEAVRAVIAADRAGGMASLMTVQLQGQVAKDEAGPVPAPFPNLSRFLPALARKGAAFADPPVTTDGAVYMDEVLPDLGAKFPGVDIFTDPVPAFVDLDNEPELWGSTHAEVQDGLVDPGTFIQKTIALAKALKGLEPGCTLFGPVHYGFNGIVNWQNASGFTGSYWFTDRYLQELASASASFGARLVDVYDFHWYSEARSGDGTRVTDLQGASLTADQVQAIVQSPRSLWDPGYTENSWIASYLGQPVDILGRLRTRIAADWPGTRLALSEYANGGDRHIAGAIAQADNLGSFGRLGVFAANLWPLSADPVYPFAGFRMFRDYDGRLGAFGDRSIPATSSDDSRVTAYLSQDSATAGRYVVVALNRSAAAQTVTFTGLPAAAGTARIYRLDGSPVPVLAGTEPASLASWATTLPPLTVSTIEIR